jgi:hypothetical protein
VNLLGGDVEQADVVVSVGGVRSDLNILAIGRDVVAESKVFSPSCGVSSVLCALATSTVKMLESVPFACSCV